MRVRLHKIHRDRHLMEMQRDDGTTLRRELETRSTLRHDLMHWAFERAAGLRDSFWGRLERGEDPDQDRSAMATRAPERAPAELHATEMVVGMLQGAAARDVDPVAFVAFAGEMLALQGHRAPAFLTSELVRAVTGQRRGAPRGGQDCALWPPCMVWTWKLRLDVVALLRVLRVTSRFRTTISSGLPPACSAELPRLARPSRRGRPWASRSAGEAIEVEPDCAAACAVDVEVPLQERVESERGMSSCRPRSQEPRSIGGDVAARAEISESARAGCRCERGWGNGRAATARTPRVDDAGDREQQRKAARDALDGDGAHGQTRSKRSE